MTDSEMLDWLESAARKSHTGISFDWVPSVDGEAAGFRFMRQFLIGEARRSLRSAISAAACETELREAHEARGSA